jgi:tetratricopeptide (TPR) repeat protein
MGDVWLQVMPRSDAERAILDRDYAPKMLREDIAGDEKTLEVHPHDARVRTDLAFCYLEAGRPADAIAQLEEAVRLEPMSAYAHYDLAATLLSEKRFEEAGAQFAAAVRLKPGFSEAHNNLGVVRFLTGRTDEAMGSYVESLRLNPGNTEAQNNLAGALAAQASRLSVEGRVEEAVSRYRRALQLKPDLPAALVDLAWTLATSERPDIRSPAEAVELAERAAHLTKSADPLVLDTLAAAYFAAGRVTQAVTTARAAYDLARNSGAEELASRVRERLAFYERQPR